MYKVIHTIEQRELYLNVISIVFLFDKYCGE